MPPPPSKKTLPNARRREALRAVGAEFHARGWALGTSTNYSVRLSREPLRLLVTASGKDKGRLGAADFVEVGEDGRPVRSGGGQPSAETALHLVLSRRADVGAVLHTHSVCATILSDVHGDAGALAIEGYEMLKGLSGVTTHEHCERVPIFENTQDMPALAGELEERLQEAPGATPHGFLLRRHGLYTWGRHLHEARRHVEIFEFLFEVLARQRELRGTR